MDQTANRNSRRRIAPEEQATSDLAYHAAVDCLKKSGLTPQDIDLILVATMTPDHFALQRHASFRADLGASHPHLISTQLAPDSFMD